MSLRTSLVSGAIILVVLVAYRSTLACGIFPWDDQEYLTAAAQLVQDPLEVTSPVMGNFHPLAMISLALDQWWSGSNAWWAHLTNILLHALNAVLVFLLARALMRSGINAALVALLFAVHPMHVEGVAWISERKNLLYVLFFLASCLRYLHYLRHPSPWVFIQVLLLFLASSLSKAQAVTLPLALFSVAVLEEGWSTWKRRSVQLLPLLLISLLFSAVAIAAQQDGGYLHWGREAQTLERLLLAPLAFATTFRRLLLPYDLSVIHPVPDQQPFPFAASIAFVILTIGLFWQGVRKGERTVPAIIMMYVAAVLPVIQIVPIGSVLTADRYGYLASIPVMALCVAGLGTMKVLPSLRWAICGVGILLFIGMTKMRSQQWCTPIVLFEQAVERYPESELAHMNLAGELIRLGDLPLAKAHLEQALAIDESMVEALIAAGQIDIRDDRPEEALRKANRTISLAPEHRSIYLAYLFRAQAHKMMGKPEQALKDLMVAAQHNGRYPPIHHEQGICYAMMGEHRSALNSYRKARSLGNNEPALLLNIAISQGWTGNYGASISTLDEVLTIDQRSTEAWFLKGIALGRLNKGGCVELARARALGHVRADDALVKLCP